MILDEIDREIVRLLQEDASLTARELADHVGLTSTPCWRRVQILEREGVICADEWERVDLRCALSFQRLTDPAKGSACTHRACCNYNVLREYVGRSVSSGSKECPLATCGVKLQRTRDVERDTELQAQLEALPADLPTFVEQSILDRWVSYCELGADAFSGHYLRNCAAGEWAKCLLFTRPFAHGRLGRKCTDAQRAQLEAHQRAAADALRATTALRRPKYGGFVHGCHDHCPATRSGSWEHTKVGDVALADAVRRWWAGDATVHDPGCIADFAGGCAPSCWGLQPWPDPRPLVERQIKALGGAARGGRRARRLRREDSSDFQGRRVKVRDLFTFTPARVLLDPTSCGDRSQPQCSSPPRS